MKQTLAKREIHNKIDDFNKNIELEERVHYEIETFLEESRQVKQQLHTLLHAVINLN